MIIIKDNSLTGTKKEILKYIKENAEEETQEQLKEELKKFKNKDFIMITEDIMEGFNVEKLN